MMRSFRIRILVWTVGVAGLTLLVFSVVSGIALRRMKLSGVDETMLALTGGRLPPPIHLRFWDDFVEPLNAGLERSLGAPALLRVYAADPKMPPVEHGPWPGDDWRALLPPATGVISREEMELRGNGSLGQRDDGPPRGGPRRGGHGFDPPVHATIAFHSWEMAGRPYRFVVYSFPGYNVVVGADLTRTLSDLRQARRSLFLGLPLALVLLGVGAWFFAGRAIKPIRKLEKAAANVSAQTLGARIASEGEDEEFSGLIATFNEMTSRLQRSFEQASRFSADAAHELKTPLAILQGNLESALQSAPDDSEDQQALGSMLEETQRLGAIVRKLLVLTQADAGRLPLKREPVALDALVSSVVAEYAEHASGVHFETELGGVREIDCDAGFVSQILQNLISNAVKYNLPHGGVIAARTGSSEGVAWVLVESEGQAIPEADRERIFERFTRLDASRNRGIDGLGLGLSLSREFARAHGGELEIVAGPPGRNCFKLSLPIGD